MQELIGQTLGKYRLESKIGQGGMATVFKAHQADLNRYVAVKILPPSYAEMPGFMERFKREAQAIAQLEHPHILPVYDYGQQGAYSYLVMRYIPESRSLMEVMRQPLTLQQSLHYLRQVASALDYAHQRGIIHRDIKPSNILLDKDWAFLADFGLARLMEATTQLTRTGTGMGTPAYMSPEQGVGGHVDQRTDVYAVGVIAYQMFTGQIPHQAETPHAIIYKRNHEAPPSLRQSNPNLPTMVDQCVQTALATLPDQRFQSSGAFITALSNTVEQNQAGNVLTTVMERVNQPSTAGSSQPRPTVVSQRFCSNCGQGLAAEATFCNRCGTAVTVTKSNNSNTWLWLAIGGGLVTVMLLLVIFGGLIMSRRTTTPAPTAIVVLATNSNVIAAEIPPTVKPIEPTPTQPINNQVIATEVLPTVDEATPPPDVPTDTATPNPTATIEPFMISAANPFKENFIDSTLDETKWAFEPGNGTIEVGNGLLQLSSQAENFPLVYTPNNPFPESGNFRLKVVLRYDNITERGVGFRMGDSLARYGMNQDIDRNELYQGRIIEVWQDIENWHVSVGDDNRQVFTLPAPDTNSHEIEINYLQQVYQIMVDNKEVYRDTELARYPQVIWLGNPAQVSTAGDWSSLAVKSISIEMLDNSATLQEAAPPVVPADKGQIILQGSSDAAGLSSQVQWLDGSSTWQNVDNWQGALDNQGKISWLVEAKDFGKGPFRWVVYDSNGSVIFESDSFNLPNADEEKLINFNIISEPTPIPLGQNCNSDAGSTFINTWQNYRHLLGCPSLGQSTISTIAEERFQGGHMFWRKDTDEIYVIYDGNGATEGRWQTDPNWSWARAGEPDPNGVGLTPPPGLVEPVRGFGWVWRTFLGGADGQMGWALDKEYGFDNTGQSQYFEQGLMFKGSGARVYVLLTDGRFWAQ